MVIYHTHSGHSSKQQQRRQQHSSNSRHGVKFLTLMERFWPRGPSGRAAGRPAGAEDSSEYE